LATLQQNEETSQASMHEVQELEEYKKYQEPPLDLMHEDIEDHPMKKIPMVIKQQLLKTKVW
jgi:hypothetical protein